MWEAALGAEPEESQSCPGSKNKVKHKYYSLTNAYLLILSLKLRMLFLLHFKKASSGGKKLQKLIIPRKDPQQLLIQGVAGWTHGLVVRHLIVKQRQSQVQSSVERVQVVDDVKGLCLRPWRGSAIHSR